MRSVLVVYYSRTGITERLASRLTGALEGKRIVQVATLKKYLGASGFLRGCLDMIRQRDPVVYPPPEPIEAADFDLIVVAAPIWAGKAAAPLRHFVRQYVQGARRTALLITHGGENAYEPALDDLDALLGIRRTAALSLCSANNDMDEQLDAFAGELLALLS